MSLSFVHELVVPAGVIDANGHVNNVAYIQWMQDAAMAHAEAVGCTRVTRELNATWVVRSHQIEYRRPAFLGNVIQVKTWIHDCRAVSSRRRYEFWREAGPGEGPNAAATLLARGETDWVFLDIATLKPVAIPEAIQRLYLPEGPAAENPR